MPLPTSISSPPAAIERPAASRRHDPEPRWLGLSSRHWICIVVALGIALRSQQYLFNRSLWLDEALMVLNLMHRSFHQLAQPLNYQLVAPLLWLYAEKSCSLLFGRSELAFRAVAIAGGTLAVFVVAVLARRLLAPRAALVAVALFVLSPPLIYYSSELKPYGTDPFACGLLWLLGFWSLRGRPSAGKLALLSLAGAALLWFSHPALFVASAFGIAVLISALQERTWRRLAPFVPVFLVWTVSFGAEYWLTLRISSANRALPQAYPFFTFPIRFSTIDMAIQSVFVLQRNPITLLLGVALFCGVIGVLYFWLTDRVACCFLVLPVFFALAASNRSLYPLPGRFYLFFTPALYLLVAAGTEELISLARSRSLAIALLALLFFQPVLSAADIVNHHMPAEELRPVLQYVQRHQQPGDTWYIYYYAQPAYQYYAEAYGLKGEKVVLGTGFRASRPVHKDWE